MTPTRDTAEIGAIAASLLGIDPIGVEWQVLQTRGRAMVLRGAGVIVKSFDEAAYFATELAGFDVVGRLSPGSGPQLRASSADELTILMEDLGEAPTVADALLGSDAGAAEQAIYDYVDALVELHDQTASAMGAGVDPRWMSDFVGIATSTLAGDVTAPLVTIDALIHEQVMQAQSRLMDAGDLAVFSFGDMCPDNNLMTPQGFKFIDLEASGFVHPSFDLANIVLPFPTCWCCFDLPERVRRSALDRYGDARGESALDELDSAALLFAVLTLGITAVRILPQDDDLEFVAGHELPRNRQRTLHRLQRASELLDGSDRYAASTQWLRDCLAGLNTAWPNLEPFPLAPAFRASHELPRST